MGISTTADVPLAADALLEKVDCVTNLTDNTVVASLPVILDKAAKRTSPYSEARSSRLRSAAWQPWALTILTLESRPEKWLPSC